MTMSVDRLTTKTEIFRRRPFALLAAAGLAGTAIAASATAVVADEGPSEVVYSTALPEGAVHSPSWAFGSQHTYEFGSFIDFEGDARDLDTITVGLNSWACETGRYQDESCVTTEGSSYDHPITVNVYELDETGERPAAGELVTSLTQSVAVPFRPSSTPDECDNGQMWFSDAAGTCQNGFAFDATFDFSSTGVELPDAAIVTVAFETRATTGIPAGPYDVLNFALADTAPSVGTRLYDDALIFNSNRAVNYDDEGAAGVGVLRHTTGWSSYVPVITVSASGAPVDPEPEPTEPGQPAEPGEPVTESVQLGDATVTFDAVLGDHPSGELVLSSEYFADPSTIGELPADAQFSFGAYSYELNVAEGTTATVTIETETPANTLFKFMDGEWDVYPAEFSGTAITFDLTDGGQGDLDGEANGVIVDPVAPALVATFTG